MFSFESNISFVSRAHTVMGFYLSLSLQHFEYLTEVSFCWKVCQGFRQSFVSCGKNSQLVVSVQCPQPTTSIRDVSVMYLWINALRCVSFVDVVNTDGSQR